MNALADYGSSSDDDGSGDEAMPPAPAPAPAPALPSAAALLNGPARPPTEAALPSAAALLKGPARPPTEDVRPRLGPARPPAKRKRGGASGGLMAPPQMRRPNVSTEAVGSWSSKATTKKFQSKEREKLSRR